MAEPARPAVSVVILAWGAEPVLAEAVAAALASEQVGVDVVLVDNGCTTDAVERAARLEHVTVVRPGRNTGFAGGCNLGARHARGEYLAFINGDAVVAPPALARLVESLTPDVGLASASLRLYDDPDRMNSAGNPVHYSGLSWAGGLGDPASEHSRATDVASATGAATVVRADRFAALGGFCEPLFAYCEDSELSLRAWQRGWRVVYVPDAVVLHRYEFSRNDQKLYLLERNRLFMLLTLYERRTLLVLAPALVALEFAVFAVAAHQGWWRKKVAGWIWLWRNRTMLRERRRVVQSARLRSDAEIAWLLTGDFAAGDAAGFSAPRPLRAASEAYWAICRRLLHATSPSRLPPSELLSP